MGEEHPAHGGDMGGLAGTRGDRGGQDAAGRESGDVDDVVAVEDAQGRRLPCPRDELLQMRGGDLRQGGAREGGVAELQDARGEPEEAPVGLDVAEVGQGQQQPAGGGAGQLAGAGHLAERTGGMLGVEGADDG